MVRISHQDEMPLSHDYKFITELTRQDGGVFDSLNEQGVSMKKLQEMPRHKSRKTTETYLRKIDSDLSVALRLLETKDTQWDTQIKEEAINE